MKQLQDSYCILYTGLSLAVSMELHNLGSLRDDITFHTGKIKPSLETFPLAGYDYLFILRDNNVFDRLDHEGTQNSQGHLLEGACILYRKINNGPSTLQFQMPSEPLNAIWNHYFRVTHVLTRGDNFQEHELPYLVDEDKICSFAVKLWDILNEER